jgi:hypothetical protein
MAQRAGRVGGVEHLRVDAFGRQGPYDPFKPLELPTGERVVGFVSHSQVREQALED